MLFRSNQLAFLVSNSTSDVDANNNDASLLVDSNGIFVGNPAIGTSPDSAIDCRDGNITLSDSGNTADQSVRWTAYNSNGRFEAARIVCNAHTDYSGDLAFYTRAPNSNVATGANGLTLWVGGNGNVGIGGQSSSWKLAVAGSLHAASVSSVVKNFLIDHPTKPGFWLKHGCCETDTPGDNIYRRKLECVQGKNEFELPEWFSSLNENTMVWVNPFKHRGLAWGETIGNTLHIDCSKSGTYLALIIGTRCDEGAKGDWTGAEIPNAQ